LFIYRSASDRASELPSVTYRTRKKRVVMQSNSRDKVDDVDKKLVSILQDDGRMSLSKIGEELGMSHVAVSKRLEKLVAEDLVKVTAGFNAEKLDMKVLFLGLEVDDLDVAEELSERYSRCPRVLMIAPVTGRYNLFALMVADDSWSLESIAGTCSIRTEPGVRRSETWVGNAPIFPTHIAVRLAPEETRDDEAPCGRECADCRRYITSKCLGCPATVSYRGALWKKPPEIRGRSTRSKS
jgi:DNA-binding Lrp family transcriptional regulator